MTNDSIRSTAAIAAAAGALAGLAAFLTLQSAFGPAAPAEDGSHPTAAAPGGSATANAAETDQAPENAKVAMRLASLSEQVVQLGSRLEALELRRTAVEPETGLSALDADTLVAADPEQQRSLVLTVLEQERAREAAEEREDRLQRELARAEQRADRIAEELELSGAERDTLAAVLAEEGQDRLELVEEMRALDPADRAAREELGDRFGALRETTAAEIELRMGVDRAQQIETLNDERRGPGGFGRGGLGGRRGN